MRRAAVTDEFMAFCPLVVAWNVIKTTGLIRLCNFGKSDALSRDQRRGQARSGRDRAGRFSRLSLGPGATHANRHDTASDRPNDDGTLFGSA
jgi:hypothetical protein